MRWEADIFQHHFNRSLRFLLWMRLFSWCAELTTSVISIGYQRAPQSRHSGSTCVCVTGCLMQTCHFKPANISQHSISWPLNWKTKAVLLGCCLPAGSRIPDTEVLDMPRQNKKAPKGAGELSALRTVLEACELSLFALLLSIRGRFSPREAVVFKDGWSVCGGNQTCV